MTKTELLEIIRNGENSGVEFKRDAIKPVDLAEELVAFANLEAGCVLLGVEDDGSISGLTPTPEEVAERLNAPPDADPDLLRLPTIQRVEQWVMNIARDKIRPEIIPYFEVIRDVEPGKDVAVVRVQRGYTVHHVWRFVRSQVLLLMILICGDCATTSVECANRRSLENQCPLLRPHRKEVSRHGGHYWSTQSF